MGQPYSTTAQVLNQALASLATQAGWNVTELTGDVAARIGEADREIDSRLAGLEVALPFATNPPLLQDLSVLYARYACFRDLYSAGQPTDKNPQAQGYLDRFEKKFEDIKGGWAKLLDTSSVPVAMTKFTPLYVGYPQTSIGVDEYPAYPDGPLPDPPGIDY